MARRGANRERKPLFCWNRLNDYVRWVERLTGKKPTAEDLADWHTQNKNLWPPKSVDYPWAPPSLEEVKLHAKTVRSTEAVVNYFRGYRALKKDQRSPQQPTAVKQPNKRGRGNQQQPNPTPAQQPNPAVAVAEGTVYMPQANLTAALLEQQVSQLVSTWPQHVQQLITSQAGYPTPPPAPHAPMPQTQLSMPQHMSMRGIFNQTQQFFPPQYPSNSQHFLQPAQLLTQQSTTLHTPSPPPPAQWLSTAELEELLASVLENDTPDCGLNVLSESDGSSPSSPAHAVMAATYTQDVPCTTYTEEVHLADTFLVDTRPAAWGVMQHDTRAPVHRKRKGCESGRSHAAPADLRPAFDLVAMPPVAQLEEGEGAQGGKRRRITRESFGGSDLSLGNSAGQLDSTCFFS